MRVCACALRFHARKGGLLAHACSAAGKAGLRAEAWRLAAGVAAADGMRGARSHGRAPWAGPRAGAAAHLRRLLGVAGGLEQPAGGGGASGRRGQRATAVGGNASQVL